MLDRKILEELHAWKNRENRKTLILAGARQVGKTCAVRMFGEKEYEEVLEINFDRTPDAKFIFEGNLDVDSLVMALRFRFPDLSVDPKKTLLFFDEIQDCPEAVTSLKFWTDDGRYDVICSGSLLGIDYKRPQSFPVGYVDFLFMYGLDFEEFLWALSIRKELIEQLKGFFERREPVPVSVNEQMMKYYRTFIATGGLPEAVQTYVDTKDFREVDRVQKDILQGYQYDIAHYASPSEKIKAEKCFFSLSQQLLDKENHKFQYSVVEKNGKAQKFGSSIEWLRRADIVYLSTNVTQVRYDLEDQKIEDNFRVYTADLTLLTAMRDLYFKQNIIENTLIGNSKGGIYECAAADALHKQGYTAYFFKNESQKKEVDFMVQEEGKPVLIEVKGGNKRPNFLKEIIKKNPDFSAYKFADANIGVSEDGIVTAPLYMICFLKKPQD